MASGKIESIRIRGFRSLADVEISDMPQATVLIGANGSGKSNFIRFFDMLSLMLVKTASANTFKGKGAPMTSFLSGNSRYESYLRGELA